MSGFDSVLWRFWKKSFWKHLLNKQLSALYMLIFSSNQALKQLIRATTWKQWKVSGRKILEVIWHSGEKGGQYRFPPVSQLVLLLNQTVLVDNIDWKCKKEGGQIKCVISKTRGLRRWPTMTMTVAMTSLSFMFSFERIECRYSGSWFILIWKIVRTVW